MSKLNDDDVRDMDRWLLCMGDPSSHKRVRIWNTCFLIFFIVVVSRELDMIIDKCGSWTNVLIIKNYHSNCDSNGYPKSEMLSQGCFHWWKKWLYFNLIYSLFVSTVVRCWLYHKTIKILLNALNLKVFTIQ